MSTKILHLSDLHIGMNRDKEYLKFKKICAYLKDQYGKEDYENKLVIITGDISDEAQTEQLEAVSPLLDDLENNGFIVWPIPGNHDHTPRDGIIGNAKKWYHKWVGSKWMWYYKYEKEYIKRFEDILLSNRKKEEVRQLKFPQYFQLKNGKNKIHFIGLNSTDIENINFKGGQGGIGTGQIDALDPFFKTANKNKNDLLILSFHHHPFNFPDISDKLWHQMVNAAELMNKIKNNNVGVLLFGHEHWHFYNNTGLIDNKKSGIPHVLSCACSANPDGQAFSVTKQGNVFKRPQSKGCYGWDITIDAKNQVQVNMLPFN